MNTAFANKVRPSAASIGLTWLRRNPAGAVAIAAMLMIVVPALFFGPWLPLIDLVSFVGMNTYPPQLSYGPLHVYTFQFTYEGHYLISRLLSDLHVPAGYQIVVFYLFQALTAFAIVWRSLTRVVANVWVCAVGIAVGSLAFWDGVFLWGGPLAYSLAGSCLAIATFLTMREAAEPQFKASWAIALLVMYALYCHPFAALFAGILGVLRFAWVRRARWHTTILGVAVLTYSYVIIRDSPPGEAGASRALIYLFGFSVAQMKARLVGLFAQDNVFVGALFGSVPVADSVLFIAYAGLRLFGFVVCPIIAVRERALSWPRMIAILDTVIAVLYLFAWDTNVSPVPEWPQRILTLYSPFTMLGGLTAVVYVVGEIRDITFSPTLRKLRWGAPIAILAFMTAVEVPVLRRGRGLESNYKMLRDGIVESGLKNAYVVVADIDTVRPFYLRCIPFLLFSDRMIIAQHLMIATEWHFQERHPSKVLENAIDVGRPRFLGKFSCDASGHLKIDLVEQTDPRFPVLENTNVVRWGNVPNLAADQFKQGMALLDAGVYASALEHFNSVVHLRPNDPHAWNDGGAALFRAERFADAAKYFEQAVKCDPALMDARLNLAKALVRAGQEEASIRALEDALKVKPDYEPARQLLDQLRPAAATSSPSPAKR